MDIQPTYVKIMLVLTVVLIFLGAAVFYKQQDTESAPTIQEGFATEENCFVARGLYFIQYPDARETGMDPWNHYNRIGKGLKYKWPSCQLTTPILSFCPSFAPQIQTAKGNTDCCQGEIVDGKCSGTTFCTISPTHDGIPNCNEAWKQYYLKKGETNCPSTLPFYFEDVKKVGGIKGCSASATNKEGTAPSNIQAKQCKIYGTDRENRQNADSCYVERQRLLVQCPVFNGIKGQPQMQKQGNRFQYYFCNYTIPGALPLKCFEDRTTINHLNSYDPNWRRRSNAQMIQADFCSNFLTSQKRKEEERKKLAEEKRKRGLLERQLQQGRAALAKAEAERQALIAERRRAAEELRKARQECSSEITNLRQRLNRLR